MTRQGFEAYKLYLALQRHFSTNYDFFKYNGKVNASVEAYEKRNDLYSFEKLTKIVQPDDLLDFYVCHFLENPKCWIRSMNKPRYENYKATIKNFPTKFREDLQYLSQHNPADLMATNDIPLIHKLCMEKKVSMETLIAMDKFFPFIDRHDEEVKVPFAWPDHIAMLKNYRPFFVKHVTEIHKDVMKEELLNG